MWFRDLKLCHSDLSLQLDDDNDDDDRSINCHGNISRVKLQRSQFELIWTRQVPGVTVR